MKKKLLLIVMIIAMCFTMTGCIRINVGESDDDDRSFEEGGASVPSDIKKIDIEWVGGKIDIVYGDVDEISFAETADGRIDKDKIMCYKVSGSELEIKFAKPSKLINFKDTSKDLTLTIPKDLILEELSIDGVSSNINIEHQAFIKELDIDTVSGNVEAYLYGGADEIKIDSVSGDTQLYTPDEGFTLEFDSVSGVFASEFETTSNGSTFVYGDGRKDYEADTVSGNITIRKIA